MKKGRILLKQALIGLIPIAYLLSIWNSLPTKVPIHYNLKNEVDTFGSKCEIFGLIILMFLISLLVSTLMLNIDKLDPKKISLSNSTLISKISWSISILLTLISIYIIYSTENYTQRNQNETLLKFIVVVVSLLFTIVGNFMNNIKPNYFIGIRTPWNIDNEENWRMTHNLGSKVWFFGGLIMILLVFYLHVESIFYVMGYSIIPLAVIPFLYSYYLTKQKKN